MDNKISMSFKKEDLQNLGDHIADILCWLSGFKAGIEIGKDEFFDNPFNFLKYAILDLRDFNLKIKDSLNKEIGE